MRKAFIVCASASFLLPFAASAATRSLTMGVGLTIVAPCDPRVGGSGCHTAPTIVATGRPASNAPHYSTVRPPSVVAPGLLTTTY